MFSMDADEARAWVYLVDNPLSEASDVALACGVSLELAQTCIDRIGTPREVFEEESKKGVSLVREEILDHAKNYISVDRAATHGRAEDSFSQIAGHWSWWLQDKLKAGETVTPYDVAQMMVGFKQARMKHNPKHLDSAKDLCGYGALAGEIGAKDA
jgi:hypothetical protein